MIFYPEPDDLFILSDPERPVAASYSGGPEILGCMDTFETKRRMKGIVLPELEFGVNCPPDLPPEAGCCRLSNTMVRRMIASHLFGFSLSMFFQSLGREIEHRLGMVFKKFVPFLVVPDVLNVLPQHFNRSSSLGFINAFENRDRSQYFRRFVREGFHIV
jgi:hypothetical protein